MNGRAEHVRGKATPREPIGAWNLESAASLRTPAFSGYGEGNWPRRATNHCAAKACDCCSYVTGKRVSVGESRLCNRSPAHFGVLDRRTHSQRGASMCGIASGGHATCFLVNPNGSLLEWDSGCDQLQDLGHRRSGIERTFTPPVEITISYVGHVDAATVAKTFGNAEGHPEWSANPIPGSQTEQDADSPLLEIPHQVTSGTPNVALSRARLQASAAAASYTGASIPHVE